ncbi:MAG: lytic polysaccharide monooxygenase [Gammaproteobacteria bacterium]|nr:lytic polysaccharide monooxygenase [Gammaproteobacteria bacterium]
MFKSSPLLLILALTLAMLNHTSMLFAHGTMVIPESRVYQCRFNGNPENHQDPACRAAVEAGGTQALYDWNGVRQGSANGQHQALIPDGELCSGGTSTFRGLDLARADWQSTAISPDANGQFEFIYYATAPHATRDMIFYMTPEGWNPSGPLRWSEMEEFCRLQDVPLVDIPGGRKGYRMPCALPSRTGKHVIFHIWQRSDSPEAFYSCSDVQFSESPNLFPIALGTITSSDHLPAGTRLTFRLMDESFSDIESIEVELTGDEGHSATWPFVLAQAVNRESQLVRIGQRDESGVIEPVMIANSNVVYSLTQPGLSFVIDKQLPDDTNPDQPDNPDTPDNPCGPVDTGDVDFSYPTNIGEYQPGTIVKGRDNHRYQCKPFPFSGWCNLAPAYYEPGLGYAWQDAWIKL